MRIAEPQVSITITHPKGAAEAFGGDESTVARRILEDAAVERYRAGLISRGQVSRILGLSWPKTEEFLASRKCDRRYGLQELEEDRKTAAEIFGPE